MEFLEKQLSELKLELHQQAMSEFIEKHSNRLFEDGGWELGYLPEPLRHPDEPTTYATIADIRELLLNWPSWADDQPAFPENDMSDIDALTELLTNGYPYDDIEGFQNATDAELYAVLALTNVAAAEWQLRSPEDSDTGNKSGYGSRPPWDVINVARAGSLLVEAMETVCYAQHSLSAAQLSEFRTEMQAKRDQQIRLDARKDIGIAGARAKLASDPKQAEKEEVFQCWKRWQKNPESYPTTAAFARDMLEKYQSLKSSQVIERWCRGWRLTLPAQ